MPFLGLADAAGIQDYLFRQPELKEIARASRRVENLCTKKGDYRELAGAHGVECLVAAGGNAALRADSDKDLKSFFRALSHRLLAEGTGLEIIVAIEEFEDGDLPAAYRRALWKLERRKQSQPRSLLFAPPGLGAIKVAGANPEPRYFADPDDGYNERAAPLQFNHVICKSWDERSDLLAVVSVDGIGMGQKFNHWLNGWIADPIKGGAGAARDRAFAEEFDVWSKHLKARWDAGWQRALDTLDSAFPPASGYALSHQHLPTRERGIWCQRPTMKEAAEWAIPNAADDRPRPFRPCRHIYQGGDDLTFVADARIALDLTACLLRALADPDLLPEGETLPPAFRTVPASAGLVFVDSHHPFWSAVHMADTIRREAKRTAVEVSEDAPAPTLTWWLNRQGTPMPPEAPFDGATRKPYPLDPLPDNTRPSWEWLSETALPGAWAGFGPSRGKWKAVQSALSEGDGGETVKRLLRLRPLRDEENQAVREPFAFAAPFAEADTGCDPQKRTVLLDAGELFDLYFPLHAAPVTAAAQADGENTSS